MDPVASHSGPTGAADAATVEAVDRQNRLNEDELAVRLGSAHFSEPRGIDVEVTG